MLKGLQINGKMRMKTKQMINVWIKTMQTMRKHNQWIDKENQWVIKVEIMIIGK